MAIGKSQDSSKSINSTGVVVKFLCSYGGKILPRHPDRKLRYVGGHTRILAVPQSLSFSEILLKLEELYGSSTSLRCQLPNEDLDALISITSDEDLVNIIEEYDQASKIACSNLKIRAFLSPPKSSKKVSPPPSSAKSSSSSSVENNNNTAAAAGRFSFSDRSSSSSPSSTPPCSTATDHHHCCHNHQISKSVRFPVYNENNVVAGRNLHYYYYSVSQEKGKPSQIYYLVKPGNYW